MRSVIVLTVLLVLVLLNVASAKLPQGVISINVFAVVSNEMENAALDASHDLKARTGLESFPLKGYQIHCTLYMTRYKKEVKEQVIKLVKQIAKNYKPFPVSTSGIQVTKGNWVFLKIDKNKELQQLANELAEKLSKLRYKDNYIPKWVDQYPEKKKNIAAYGSPNVFEQYEPHLTLLPATDDTAMLGRFLIHSISQPYGKKITGKIIGIGVGESVKYGQIKKADKIFLFK